MKKYYLAILAFSFIFISTGSAADQIQHFSIRKALSDSRSNSDVDRRIKLRFGDHHHRGRAWTAIRRTFAVGKTNEEACNRAFNSAIIALQKRAKKEGRHSVVDIYSYHKKRKYSSAHKYECAVGSMMVAVTLRGRVR